MCLESALRRYVALVGRLTKAIVQPLRLTTMAPHPHAPFRQSIVKGNGEQCTLPAAAQDMFDIGLTVSVCGLEVMELLLQAHHLQAQAVDLGLQTRLDLVTGSGYKPGAD